MNRPVTGEWKQEIRGVLLRQDLSSLLARRPEARTRSGAEVAGRLRARVKRRRSRLIRYVAATLAATVSVFIMVAAFLYWRLRESRQQQREVAAERDRAKAEQARAERAETDALARKADVERLLEKQKAMVADAYLLRAERDENAGNIMSALAQAVASVRTHKTPEAYEKAWYIHRKSPHLVWTSPIAAWHEDDVTSVAFDLQVQEAQPSGWETHSLPTACLIPECRLAITYPN